jgi:RNA polymerase sigma factor (TIGR02999 family)
MRSYCNFLVYNYDKGILYYIYTRIIRTKYLMVDEKINKGRITELLLKFSRGDREAYIRLFPLIYEQLRRLAHYQVDRWQISGQLRRTELIHEAYIKLIDQTQMEWKDRAHFYTVAARAMRHILVDHHRKEKSQKRGGSKEHLRFDEELSGIEKYAEHLETLQELMEQLADVNERMHNIVDLRFFAGFTIEEIADLLNVSTSTVDRDWKAARTWLYRQLVGN